MLLILDRDPLPTKAIGPVGVVVAGGPSCRNKTHGNKTYLILHQAVNKFLENYSYCGMEGLTGK